MKKEIEGKRIRFFFWEEWSDIFSGFCNWYNFTFIRADFELAPYKCSIEANFGLLGLNISVDYFYGEFHPLEEEE